MNSSPKFAVKNPPVVSESFGDEAVIVHLEKGIYYSVRGTAFEIWIMIADGASVAAIVDRLCDRYEGSKTKVEEGVLELIGTLRQEGLIHEDGVSEVNLRGDHELRSSASAAKPAFEAPLVEKYTDVEELLALDPIHDVDATGWPQPNPEKARR